MTKLWGGGKRWGEGGESNTSSLLHILVEQFGFTCVVSWDGLPQFSRARSSSKKLNRKVCVQVTISELDFSWGTYSSRFIVLDSSQLENEIPRACVRFEQTTWQQREDKKHDVQLLGAVKLQRQYRLQHDGQNYLILRSDFTSGITGTCT